MMVGMMVSDPFLQIEPGFFKPGTISTAYLSSSYVPVSIPPHIPYQIEQKPELKIF